jgi:hypothetical protein
MFENTYLLPVSLEAAAPMALVIREIYTYSGLFCAAFALKHK